MSLVSTTAAAHTHPSKVAINIAIVIYFWVRALASMSNKSNIGVGAVANVSVPVLSPPAGAAANICYDMVALFAHNHGPCNNFFHELMY